MAMPGLGNYAREKLLNTGGLMLNGLINLKNRKWLKLKTLE